jgi:hypothetical protein
MEYLDTQNIVVLIQPTFMLAYDFTGESRSLIVCITRLNAGVKTINN